MTRNEAIELSFKIKENPESHDFSSYLYGAVGLLKVHTDAGTAFAVELLITAIKEATNNNLSDFCKRRIDIAEKLIAKNSLHFYEKISKAIEYQDFLNSVPKEFRK